MDSLGFRGFACRIARNEKISGRREAIMTAMTAPSALSEAGSDRQRAAIDEDHLGRMTLGDRRLEREVLEIFVRQTVIMLERIAGAEPALAAAAAHTLTGSARGIGAWRVARAAEHLERVANGKSGAAAVDEAAEELKSATVEASAAIATRLGDVLRGH
jgi:HPt (histidine-containing phosphotransfer) domain-containing protein